MQMFCLLKNCVCELAVLINQNVSKFLKLRLNSTEYCFLRSYILMQAYIIMQATARTYLVTILDDNFSCDSWRLELELQFLSE